MRIQSVNQNNTISCKHLYIPQQETQEIILKDLNKKQLEKLLDIFDKEIGNPVRALIYSDNKFLLKAKIACKYKLDNFKENYYQIPIIESKLSFIERIAKVIHKYNESLCKTQ